MQNNTFSGLFVGQNLITLTSVDSTNTYLRNQLANSAPLPEGTVILADEQLAGRGQSGNSWYSEPGKNLTFSLLLNPAFFAISQQFLLNKAVSLAINDVLATIIGNRVKIKWPNDIYYDDKKLGGMLIENVLQGARWKHAIIGIGINVNQTGFGANLKNATSLHEILQTDYDLQNLLSQICSCIEGWYLKLRAGKAREITKTYLERLYRLNEAATYRAGGVVFTGVITDVTDAGFLQVRNGSETRLYNLKEIEFINDHS